MSVRYTDGFMVVDDLQKKMELIVKTDMANNKWVSARRKLEDLLKEANNYFIRYKNEKSFNSSMYWANFMYVNALLTFNYGTSYFNYLTEISPATSGYDKELIKVNKILGVAAMIFPVIKSDYDFREILSEVEMMMSEINNAFGILVPSLRDSLIESPLTLDENLEHLKYTILNGDVPS